MFLGRARLYVESALWSHICFVIVVEDPPPLAGYPPPQSCMWQHGQPYGVMSELLSWRTPPPNNHTTPGWLPPHPHHPPWLANPSIRDGWLGRSASTLTKRTCSSVSSKTDVCMSSILWFSVRISWGLCLPWWDQHLFEFRKKNGGKQLWRTKEKGWLSLQWAQWCSGRQLKLVFSFSSTQRVEVGSRRKMVNQVLLSVVSALWECIQFTGIPHRKEGEKLQKKNLCCILHDFHLFSCNFRW